MNHQEWAGFCHQLQHVMANAYDARHVASLYERIAYLERENSELRQHQCHASELQELARANAQIETLVSEKEVLVQHEATMLQQLEQTTELCAKLSKEVQEIPRLKQRLSESKSNRKALNVEKDRICAEARKERLALTASNAEMDAHIKRVERRNVAMHTELAEIQLRFDQVQAAHEADVVKRTQAMSEMRAFAKDHVRRSTEALMCNQELTGNLIKASNDLNYCRLLQERDHRDLRKLIEIWEDRAIPQDSPSKAAMMTNEIARIRRESFIISSAISK